MEHFFVKFCDPSYIIFEIPCGKTDKASKNNLPPRQTSVRVYVHVGSISQILHKQEYAYS